VLSDPITGSPLSPQYEEPFTLARGDFTSLLVLFSLAVEGTSLLQLDSLEMELQDIIQEARMVAMKATTRTRTVTTSTGSTGTTTSTFASSTAYVDSTVAVTRPTGVTAPSTPPRDPFSQYFGRYPALDSPL